MSEQASEPEVALEAVSHAAENKGNLEPVRFSVWNGVMK